VKIAPIVLAVSLIIALFGSAHAQEDVAPPQLLDVSFEPKTIDTSKGPVTVTVSVHVTDDLSGLKHVALFFRKAETTQQNQVEFYPDSSWTDTIDGDSLNGQFAATMTIPQYAAFGEWEMYYVMLQDNVGNRSDLWKPEDQEGRQTEDSEWPSLFNNFEFIVGASDTPQEPTEPEQPLQLLFIPTLNR
jgi:hypothetical protein